MQNQSPAQLRAVSDHGPRTVTLSGGGHCWPLHVSPNLFEGEVCRVRKVAAGQIVLEVVGDMAEPLPAGNGHTVTVTPRCFSVPPPSLAFTPGLMAGQVARVVSCGDDSLVLQILGIAPQEQKPLPPPINYVVMPRLTPLQVAQILSHLDAFVQASLPGPTEPFTASRQPFDAAQVLELAAQTPLACEDYRRHRIGVAAAGIIDILCGTGPAAEPPGILYDVSWRVASGASRMVRLRRASAQEAVEAARAKTTEAAEFSVTAASVWPLWNVSFTSEDGRTDYETVAARDASEATAIVRNRRWNGVRGFSAVLATGNDA